MLTAWQERFPDAFEKYRYALSEKPAIQEIAANTFAFLELHGLLDQNALHLVLENMSSNTKILFQLIQFMHKQGILDDKTILRLNEISIYTFDESMQTLSDELRTPHNLQRLLGVEDHQTCAYFIQNMHLGHVDQATTDAFLDQEPALDALCQALILFDLAQKTYSLENLPLIRQLTTFFTNPLMQAMFRTRNRGFSDYETPYEHLSHQDATYLIQELTTIPGHEEQFRMFFDFLAPKREKSNSQKYPSISISHKISSSLSSYFRNAIKTIHDAQDHTSICEMINIVRNHGCNADILASIRYHAAASIEEHDVYSHRTYDDLMGLVDVRLRQPHKKLPLFKQEILASPGYQKKASAILRQTSSLLSSQSTMSSQGSLDADVESGEEDYQVAKRARNGSF